MLCRKCVRVEDWPLVLEVESTVLGARGDETSSTDRARRRGTLSFVRLISVFGSKSRRVICGVNQTRRQNYPFWLIF